MCVCVCARARVFVCMCAREQLKEREREFFVFVFFFSLIVIAFSVLPLYCAVCSKLWYRLDPPDSTGFKEFQGEYELYLTTLLPPTTR